MRIACIAFFATVLFVPFVSVAETPATAAAVKTVAQFTEFLATHKFVGKWSADAEEGAGQLGDEVTKITLTFKKVGAKLLVSSSFWGAKESAVTLTIASGIRKIVFDGGGPWDLSLADNGDIDGYHSPPDGYQISIALKAATP